MKRLHLSLMVVAAIFMVVTPTFLKNYGIHLFTTWLIYMIAIDGTEPNGGLRRTKIAGPRAFFGIGAYTVAILMKAGISFWIGLPIGALLCFVIGLGLGFPALRVQTIYLAFATLGFNTAVWLVMRNEEWLTGGTYGINNIMRPEFFGMSLDRNLPFYYMVLVITVVLALLLGACCALRGERHSRHCVTTLYAPKVWAWIPAATHCLHSPLGLALLALQVACLPLRSGHRPGTLCGALLDHDVPDGGRWRAWLFLWASYWRSSRRHPP